MFKDMEKAAKKGTSTSFVLGMVNDKGEFSIHPRNNQPCQGGETRKYFSTHGERCTQPENTKPSDLHHPFPDGTVKMIAFPQATLNLHNEVTRMVRDFIIFDPRSPFRAGFKGIESHQDGCGFTITDTAVDPTVMIQGVQLMRRAVNGMQQWGFTKSQLEVNPLDVILASTFYTCMGKCVYGTNSYHWSPNLSPRRWYEGLPNNLSGGLYCDGFDYNRSYNHSLFVPDIYDDKVKGFSCPTDPKDYIKNYGELIEKIHEFRDAEPEVVDKPYKFLTYSGEQFDSHLDYIAKYKTPKK